MSKRFIFAIAAVLMLTTANAQENWEKGKPSDTEHYGYLNDYDALKTYIDKEKYPNFKLGIGTTVSEYVKKGSVYRMTNANFTETVAGNAMKMASCVDGNGNMNFSNVTRYVTAAYSAGINVYGHTLAWHSQQPKTWLLKLLADKPAEGTSRMVTEDRRCIKIDASAKENGATDNQLLIFTGSFSSNAQYVLSADVRADKEAKASTSIYAQPTLPINGTTIGDINFTTQWKTIKLVGKFSKSGRYIVLNLSELEEANKYYFDNISLKINGVEKVKNGDFEGTDVSSFSQKTAGGEVSACEIQDQIEYLYIPTPTPLTPQERHDTLVYAMDKWIKGMMSACFNRVKGWDLVNEAMSGGGNDGDGYYVLQGNNPDGNPDATWDVGGDNFYWQDYMGALEYVRQACRLARKYGPADIKLFINDYNLEGTWDLMTKDGIRASKKLWSLVHWIEKWESDGVTKIDGIGTQMHISFNKNSGAQEGLKAAITGMFQLMAKSGKMARVSELDMGYNDANGKSVPVNEMTEEQHHEMADFYEWIIKEYLSIIPPEQQWGICQWCATDNIFSGGWRANTPVGIWDSNYYRKHVYAGFVRGLSSGTTAVNEVEAQENMPIIEEGAKIYDMFGRRMNATSTEDLPRGMYIVGNKKVVKQ